MNAIHRVTDIISDKYELELLETFQKFPVFMGCVTTDIHSDQFQDMNFCIGRSSGLIQLNPILPLEVIYQSGHHSGTVGNVWSLHHERFASFIGDYSPSSVFEIGGGSGILSVKYKNSHADIDWTILEPNPSPVIDCTARYVAGFFDENFKMITETNAVVHSHIIEHVFNPAKFLNDLSRVMRHGQKMFFSVPNLAEMFKRYYTNCINFEHTLLLTEEYIDYLLSRHKFKILHKKYFLEDHSIFYAVERDNNVLPATLSSNIYEINKTLFYDYVSHFDKLIAHLNAEISKQDTTDIYLFGGHVFSQFLINRGLDISKIKSIIDNDLNKHGKRLYGTSLYVDSPGVLAEKNNPCVILKVANYADEIKKEIIDNINSSTRFLE